MDGIISCQAGCRDDIPEGTDDFIMGRNKSSLSWANFEVGASVVVQFPIRTSTAMVGMVRVSRGKVRFLESASECGCDGSVWDTCAIGTGNRLNKAVAAALQIFIYPRFGGFVTTIVVVLSVDPSYPRTSLYVIDEMKVREVRWAGRLLWAWVGSGWGWRFVYPKNAPK